MNEVVSVWGEKKPLSAVHVRKLSEDKHLVSTLFVWLILTVLGPEQSAPCTESCARVSLGGLDSSSGRVCWIGLLCLTRFPWLWPLFRARAMPQ